MGSELRVFGCRCLDLAYLSSGKIDCYVSGEEFEKSPDPGILFIKESGGIMYKKQNLKKFSFAQIIILMIFWIASYDFY